MPTVCAKPKPRGWAPVATKLAPNSPSQSRLCETPSQTRGRASQSRERLHLHYGPIDLLIDVDGTAAEVALAHQAATDVFEGVLEDLVSELPDLRRAITSASTVPTGVVAFSMWQACLPHSARFVTPMAAVAGAVADHVLNGMVQTVPTLKRAWVNNGGDIAFMLSDGAHTKLTVCTHQGTPSAQIRIRSGDGIGGIATSGWAGRSHSFGIADAVTVLAPNAASADVAATLIANEVQLPSDELDRTFVRRVQAVELQPDSDLGDAWVTTHVDKLPKQHRHAALQRGLKAAKTIMQEATIKAVFIDCQGQRMSIGECA